MEAAPLPLRTLVPLNRRAPVRLPGSSRPLRGTATQYSAHSGIYVLYALEVEPARSICATGTYRAALCSAERALADALGQLLLRETRRSLYSALTSGIAGLDATTYPVLSGLARTGATTSSEPAAIVGLDRSVTSRHASALERAGLLERRPHGRDRRATVPALNDAGQEAIDVTRARLDRHLRTFVARQPDIDAGQLAHLFTELVEYVLHPPAIDQDP